MTNEELIKFITDEFNKINVDWFIIQEKKEENNKFYPGYIHIKDVFDLNEEQMMYINDKIYPNMNKNGWEVFFTIPNMTYEELWEDTFPIWEKR